MIYSFAFCIWSEMIILRVRIFHTTTIPYSAVFFHTFSMVKPLFRKSGVTIQPGCYCSDHCLCLVFPPTAAQLPPAPDCGFSFHSLRLQFSLKPLVFYAGCKRPLSTRRKKDRPESTSYTSWQMRSFIRTRSRVLVLIIHMIQAEPVLWYENCSTHPR